MLELDFQLRLGDFPLQIQGKLDQRVTGLLGRSGAGKSSTLHVIAGLQRPQRGRAVLDGEVLFDIEAGVYLPPHRRRIGLVFQDSRLFPHYSVEGNLRYGQRLLPAGEQRIAFAEVVDLLELAPLLARKPRTLSGGEGQRVALGRALLTSPRLLLLDEPLSSLDATLKKQILPFLQRVRDQLQIPMIYVSHDLTEMLQMTARLLVLEQGRNVAQGSLLDLAQQAPVLSVLQQQHLTNVLPALVREQDEAHGITVLALGEHDHGPLLRAPHSAGIPGAKLHISVRPEEIALAAGHIAATSIQNQLPATVTRLVEHQRRALIEVDVGVPLLVEVSLRAVEQLGLAPGTPVTCLIKAQAIEYLGV